MKRFVAKIQNISRKNWVAALLSVFVFLTVGFDISCPPPESLEGIDTDLNPIFHDGVNSGDFYSPLKINAIAVDPRTGNFFVGGSFTTIDNVAAVNIAFYDKTHDRFYRLFGKGLRNASEFFSSSVNALVISGDYLFIGGSFSQTAATTPTTGLNNIARYYIGNGSLQEVQNGFFEAVSNNGLNGTVYALEVLDNNLYVGGEFFDTYTGSTAGLSKIARYAGAANCQSNCWVGISGNGLNNTVYALESGDGLVFVGGDFTATSQGNTLLDHFAVLQGGANGGWYNIRGLNNTVKALAYGNGRIYVGGSFTGQPVDQPNVNLNHIGFYSPQFGWEPMINTEGLNGDVNALALDGYLIVAGGDFTATLDASPISLNRIALYDNHPDFQQWRDFGSGLNATVSALGIEVIGSQNYRVIAGGIFTQSGDGSITNLKRVVSFPVFRPPSGFNRSPSVAGFNIGLSPLGLPNGKALDNIVNAVAADANGNVYAGGTFTKTADGTTTLNRIGRYDPGTKNWSALANGGLNNNVDALIVVGDNLYVGGLFTATADGAVTNLNHIARYNLTTNTWSPVGSNGVFVNFGLATVSAFAVKDNILYVGGNFTRTFDNTVTNLNNLAAYDLTTNTWSPFANNGMNANVNSLAIVGDDLYIGGGFTRTFDNSYFLFRITRFNLIGQTWFEFANSGLNAEAKKLIISGNYLFVNGSFSRTRDNTIILNSLARYDIAGNSWSMMSGDTESLNAAIQTNSMVQVGNDLFVGGNFHGADNGVAHYFVQFYLQEWNVPAPTSDWFDSNNWKLGTVPANNTNAIIPMGAGNINIASSDVVLNNFNFNGGNLNIAAGRTLTINGTLNLSGGTITGSGTLIIANCSPEGIIGGDSSVYIQTTLTRCVNNSGTFNFPVGTANGYSPVTFKGVSGAGNISIKAAQGAYTNSANGLPANRLARWWQIENPGGGVTNANVYFGYLQPDISGTENNFRAYRISGGMAQMTGSSVNSFSKIATAENITAFSDWTLAELSPSAAEVSVRGQIKTSSKQGISKALVSLVKPSGETVTVLTNSFGYYRFNNLQVGKTYIISVNHKKYSFYPSSQILTLEDNVTDFDFIAENQSKIVSNKQFSLSNKQK